MRRFAFTVAAVTGAVALTAGATAAFASGTDGPGTSGAATANAPGTGTPVVAWNEELQAVLKVPGLQPATVHPTRSYALLHLAIYDAVASVAHLGTPYVFEVVADPGARADAAAEQAAHDVLTGLYPTEQASFDTLLSSELASMPPSRGRAEGERVGHVTAELLLDLRAGDGSAAMSPAFTPPAAAPGAYQLTPPNFPAPVFTNWGSVTPFVLSHGDQFRPGPPPALTGAAWAQAINEVQALGQDTSTVRTADQTNEAKFWAPPIWTTWNEIADGQVTARHTNLEQTAKVLATLNVALADTSIGLYDAKYHYLFWRPITAIRAGTPGNPAVTANPTWNALATTAADPSYPGAHSTFSAAAAAVLTAAFGAHVNLTVTSDTPVGGPRHFGSFDAAATEAGLSRIFAGQHTRADHVAGAQLGHEVAHVALQAFGPLGR
jgi:hypothetical protein